MATLVKKPNSPYYYAAFRIPQEDSNGKRVWKQVRKVTKHTNRREALAAAVLIEQEAFRAAGAGDEGSQRMLAILRDATERAAQHKLTHDLAREYLRKMTELATGEPLKMYFTRQWFTEWLELRAATTKPSSLARYKGSVKAFMSHLGDTAERPLDYIQLSHISAFRDKLKREGRSSVTCNHITKDVCAALRAAVREGIIPRNPGDNIKHLETDSIERKVFTADQINKLIKAASDEWRGVILLGAFGGLRLGDAAHLPSSTVDLKENVLRFTPSKTSKAQTLPMHPELVKYFKTHKPTGTHCFPSLAPIEVGGCSGLSELFIEIMDTAEIKRTAMREKVEGKIGYRTYDLSFHCLRHSFNSQMANGGISQELRMKLTGHADKRSNNAYTHHELTTLRAAVESVPGLNGRKPKGKKP